MNILVCISKVPDTTSKIAFTDNNTKFNTQNVQYIVNPSDEWYALVRALELKEANGGKVTIITVGKAEDDAIIRKALAIGADEAVRIDAEATEAYFVAKQIADYAADKGFDLIITGKETIDYNGSEVAGMIAALLDLPYLSQALKLEVNGGVATASTDIGGGTQQLEVALPAVVSATKGLAEQRIPNMKGIMSARTKPIHVVAPSDVAAQTKVVTYELPPAKGDVKMIDAENIDQLVEFLHNEAKVI